MNVMTVTICFILAILPTSLRLITYLRNIFCALDINLLITTVYGYQGVFLRKFLVRDNSALHSECARLEWHCRTSTTGPSLVQGLDRSLPQ